MICIYCTILLSFLVYARAEDVFSLGETFVPPLLSAHRSDRRSRFLRKLEQGEMRRGLFLRIEREAK